MKLSEILVTICDHNLTKPKPYHMNRDLMTCALQLEQLGKTAGELNLVQGIKR